MVKNLKPKTYNLKPEKGFTLVEVLVSLAIFSIALTAIFYLLTNNLKEASLIKNNFIASGLVQEGMEVVRNIRDRDWFLDQPLGQPPVSNPFGTSIPDGTYRVQWDSQALLPLEPDPYLKKGSGNGLFSYDITGDTIFKRAVTISTVSSVERMVVVTVTWSERGAPKSVSVEDHLFDWK